MHVAVYVPYMYNHDNSFYNNNYYNDSFAVIYWYVYCTCYTCSCRCDDVINVSMSEG